MNIDSLMKKYDVKSKFIEYTEWFTEKESILQTNNELKTFAKSRGESCSVRMFVNGAWGFASSSKKELEKLFEKSFKLAFNASKIKKNKSIMKEFEINKDNVRATIKKNPFEIDDEEKIKILQDINKTYSYPEIKNINSTINFGKTNKLYINSLGSRITQESFNSQIYSSIVGGKKLTSTYFTKRVKKGYELFDLFDYATEIKKVEDKLKRLINAPNVKSGVYDIVVDPDLGGTFFHEAVGHALEADHIREKNTCLSLNEDVGNSNLTLYDDATLKDYWGSYTYDDEGIKSKPTLLIDKGKIVNFMNDISSFFDVNGLKKSSNGRRASPHELPIPRMSNTVVKRGDFSKEELIEKVKNGLFVSGFRGGAVEPITGVFSFKAGEAFLIEKGKITHSFRDVTLSGDLKKLLKNINGFGKTIENNFAGGFCGKKGQSVLVSEKVPHISVRGVNVGN